MSDDRFSVEFQNLTFEELDMVLKLRPKIKAKFNTTELEEVGSGCYLPTRTYDIGWKA